MQYRPLKTSRPLAALLLGLTGALGVLAIHLTGLDRRPELYALDLRFRYLSNARDAGRIVHVDIDDRSIDEIGRWPWPRRTLAGVIDVLAECGAQTIVMDIILPNPQVPRYVGEADTVYGSVRRGALIHDVPPVRVLDDAILAEAIRRGGNVLVPMHVDLGAELSELEARVLSAILAEEPDPSPDEILSANADLRGACDAETFDKIYLRMRAVAAMRRFGMPEQSGVGSTIRSGKLVPLLVTFARVARGSGFVSFIPDPDGAARRIPLLVRSGGRIHLQLSLALAVEEIGRAHGGGAPADIISISDGEIALRWKDGFERIIPLDDEGLMLINWICGRAEGPPHISCAAVARAFELRQEADRNRRLARVTQLQIALELKQADLLRLFAKADKRYKARAAAERERYVASLYDPGRIPAPPDELVAAEAVVEAEIDKAAEELRKDLDEFYLAQRPEAPEAMAKYDRLVALRDRLDGIEEANRQLVLEAAEQKRRIERYVAGKICLIGSTPTAAADIVPTPAGPQTPGVVVISNIANTILTGRFITQSHWAVNVAVILAAGALVSLIAALRPVVQAAIVSVLAACGYAAFNGAAVFGAWNVWLPAVAPLAAMLASFVVVTAFRQLTEERAKRHIRAMFAHALSPALVDRLLEDPSLAELGGQKRILTCMFSDLAGFTPISERLGAQGTVRLLNRYFDSVVDVVQHRGGGYLNKFLGDGIFCFFGAPVAHDDHAARAIRAAVEYQAEAERFNEQLAGRFGGDVRLSVRIGVATGEAMVGNCGSSDRMDYTAIGDCVNLAARLEEANKFFGTGILVSEDAWISASSTEPRWGGGMLARPLGGVFVAGQQSEVRVWNVLGKSDEAPAEIVSAFADFARAMEFFSQRKFAEASEPLRAVQRAMPEDRPAGIFLDLCLEYAAQPGLAQRQLKSATGDGTVRIALPGGGD